MPALCRDCFHGFDAAPPCPACGGRRVLRHADLFSLVVAHVDADAFFANVEKRDRPDLADRPVLIGGGRRGVVMAACYVARLRGARSAMPMFKALRAIPDAVVLRPDMAKYAREGRRIRALMQELTPLVMPLSIDEAVLDLSGTEALHGAPPACVLARFARRVEQEVGVTVSIGLAANRLMAKIAADRDKPRGSSARRGRRWSRGPAARTIGPSGRSARPSRSRRRRRSMRTWAPPRNWRSRCGACARNWPGG
jgi:DNA polymerase-4